jgi:gas vesicle protein
MPDKETRTSSNTSNQKILNTIKNIVNETAKRNGLNVKKSEQISTLIKEQLGQTMDKILEKIKKYFEDEVRIQW